MNFTIFESTSLCLVSVSCRTPIAPITCLSVIIAKQRTSLCLISVSFRDPIVPITCLSVIIAKQRKIIGYAVSDSQIIILIAVKTTAQDEVGR